MVEAEIRNFIYLIHNVICEVILKTDTPLGSTDIYGMYQENNVIQAGDFGVNLNIYNTFHQLNRYYLK